VDTLSVVPNSSSIFFIVVNLNANVIVTKLNSKFYLIEKQAIIARA
jgi:hypothetical protein